MYSVVEFNVTLDTEMLFAANHWAGTSTTKYNYNQVTTHKPKRRFMKTTNNRKTKLNETKPG